MLNRIILSTTIVAACISLAACGDSPTSPDTTVSTVSETFASRIQEGGSASKSFVVSTAGTVKIQLTWVSQADVVVRLGLGTLDGTTCVISQTVDTAASVTTDTPQITKDLGAGTYCAKLSDIGNLTTIVDFSITITKPA
jgi:uncharacterized lipoprotein YehR (DUF1307 family)